MSIKAASIREALKQIPYDAAWHGTDAPRPQDIYVVPGHERALSPDTMVVVGDRGTGKTFWSAALIDNTTRNIIAKELPRAKLNNSHVSWGFAMGSGTTAFPTKIILENLISKGYSPRNIWRAVVLYNINQYTDGSSFGRNWEERVEFVQNEPESQEFRVEQAEQYLKENGESHVIVFDGLDRMGSDWEKTRDLVGALLQVCLEYQGLKRIRMKVFIRPDMAEDNLTWAFPDASKLYHGGVDLTWARADLYGLLWHWLANSESSSEQFVKHLKKTHNIYIDKFAEGDSSVRTLPKRMKKDEDLQRNILHDVASPYMGKDPRRGKTYSWIPNHLADGKGQVSPRSFLVALRQAAEHTEEKDVQVPVHYEGIKKGVQAASDLRVQQLQEDYPWVRSVLRPLRGMTVPASEKDIKQCWRSQGIGETVLEYEQSDDCGQVTEKALGPHALEGVETGEDVEENLSEALIEIGVMNRLDDGRINVPDLFRVAAGMGRKGGVVPVR